MTKEEIRVVVEQAGEGEIVPLLLDREGYIRFLEVMLEMEK